MAVTISKMLIEVQADAEKLKAGLAKANKELDKFKRKQETSAKQFAMAWQAAIGAISFGAFVGGMKNAIDTASRLVDESSRLGMGVQQFQELDYAARMSGAENGAAALTKLQDALANAADGTGPAVDALAKLGLSAEMLGNLPLTQQMNTLADAFSMVVDPAERTQIAMDLFGKSGASMIPMLSGGSEGLAEMSRKAHELGIVMGEDMVNQLESAGDAIESVQMKFTHAFGRIAVAADWTFGGLEKWIVEFGAWTATSGSWEDAAAIGTGAGMGAGGSEFNRQMRLDFLKWQEEERKRKEEEQGWLDITTPGSARRNNLLAAHQSQLVWEQAKRDEEQKKRQEQLDKEEKKRQESIAKTTPAIGGPGVMLGLGMGLGLGAMTNILGEAARKAQQNLSGKDNRWGSVGTWSGAAASELGRGVKTDIKDMRDETRKQNRLIEETNRILRDMGAATFA